MIDFRREYPLPPAREAVYKALERKIGNTPLHQYKFLKLPNNNQVFAKLEYENPTGCHHVRIYPLLFRMAESRGLIQPFVTPVIETSIGNAGAAMVYCANELGFSEPSPPTIIIPKDASAARIKQLRGLGANLVFSPEGQYSRGYVKVLEKILANDKEEKGGKIGKNPCRLVAITKINPVAIQAYQQFVREALQQLSQTGVGCYDYYVGAVGSGTSISGIGHYLKQTNPNAKVVAVEPEEAPVAQTFKETGRPLQLESIPHAVHGVGIFGVPLEKLNIDFRVIDEFTTFSSLDWQACMANVKQKEGLPIGRSSAATLSIACKLTHKLRNANILTCVYDTDWKAV